MGMQAALSTLEDTCAEQGLDYEEVLDQRRYELDLFREYRLPLPQWANADTSTNTDRDGEGGGNGRERDQSREPPTNKPKKPSAGHFAGI